MAARPLRRFRLAPEPFPPPRGGNVATAQRSDNGGSNSDSPQTPLGLSCGPDGPALAGPPLLRKTATGLTPLPRDELTALTLAAYGAIPDLDRLTRGLTAAAAALTRGDLPLAQTAAVHLQLPDVTAEGAARLAKVADYLATGRHAGQVTSG